MFVSANLLRILGFANLRKVIYNNVFGFNLNSQCFNFALIISPKTWDLIYARNKHIRECSQIVYTCCMQVMAVTTDVTPYIVSLYILIFI